MMLLPVATTTAAVRESARLLGAEAMLGTRAIGPLLGVAVRPLVIPDFHLGLLAWPSLLRAPPSSSTRSKKPVVSIGEKFELLATGNGGLQRKVQEAFGHRVTGEEGGAAKAIETMHD
jgi:hypothetical protein